MLEVELEVLCLEAVSQVYVTAYLVLAILVVADEDNRRHSSVADELFTLGKGLQEGAIVEGALGVREGFQLFTVFVLLRVGNCLFTLAKLLSRQDFALSVVPDLDELTSQLLILKVEEVLS